MVGKRGSISVPDKGTGRKGKKGFGKTGGVWEINKNKNDSTTETGKGYRWHGRPTGAHCGTNSANVSDRWVRETQTHKKDTMKKNTGKTGIGQSRNRRLVGRDQNKKSGRNR